MGNMKDVVEKLWRYFEKQPSTNYGDASSMMEALFWMYTENNNLDKRGCKEAVF